MKKPSGDTMSIDNKKGGDKIVSIEQQPYFKAAVFNTGL
jgi:hypothetical protein